jgi:hypothetical protein
VSTGNGLNTGSYLGVAATTAGLGGVTQLFMLPNGHLVLPSGARCTFVGVHPSTRVTYALAGNGTCLAAGNVALSNVAAASTAFGPARSGCAWGSNAAFLITHPDFRVRSVSLTTGLTEVWVNSGGTPGAWGCNRGSWGVGKGATLRSCPWRRFQR